MWTITIEQMTTTLPCCFHVAEKKSIYCIWGPWTALFAWSLGPSGGLFSFAFHFRQSGSSIERLDSNQRPLLIAFLRPVHSTCAVRRLNAAVSDPADDKRWTHFISSYSLKCIQWILLQVVTDSWRETGPRPVVTRQKAGEATWPLVEECGVHLPQCPAVLYEWPAGAAAGG